MRANYAVEEMGSKWKMGKRAIGKFQEILENIMEGGEQDLKEQKAEMRVLHRRTNERRSRRREWMLW